MKGFVSFFMVFMPLAFAGCSQEASPETTPTVTPVGSTVPAPVSATAIAPAVTAPGVSVSAPDTRTVATAEDTAWMTQTLPIAGDAVKAMRKYLDSHSTSKEEAVANLTEYKNSMSQYRDKLMLAPHSLNFAKAHQLLFEGVNKSVTGAQIALLGQSMSDTPTGAKSVKDGGEEMIAGGDLLEAGLKAADETVSKLKD